METSEIIMLIQTVVQFIGLISIIILFKQIQNNNNWNKLNFTINNTWAGRLDQYLIDIKILEIDKIANFNDPEITDEQVDQIIKENKYIRPIIYLLNLLEEIAGANNLGAINEDYAYVIYSATLQKHYMFFKKLIIWKRQSDKDEALFIELEKLSIHWQERSIRELENGKKKIKKMKESLLRASGVKKTF